MFAVVLYINMNIGSSSYTGLFPWHASGVHVARVSQNFIVCPSYLMLQVCQPCISLHITHSSQIQKCTVIGRVISGMHTARWLVSMLIVFLKRLADFMKKLKFCTIPTWTTFTFLHRNSKLVILTRRLNPALIIQNMSKHCFRANPLNRNSRSFVKSTKSILGTYSWEGLVRMGGKGGVVLLGPTRLVK